MKIHLLWAVMFALVAGAGGGMVGYQIASSTGEAEPEPVKAPVIAEVKAPVKREVTAPPTLSDEDIENLIANVEDERPRIDPEKLAEMEARRKRWENMSIDQRRMMRKSFFSALAEVDGLEEIQEALQKGQLDPQKFKIDPEGIADRMEFFADTMDEQSMKTEVSKTLQGIVDQANSQLDGK